MSDDRKPRPKKLFDRKADKPAPKPAGPVREGKPGHDDGRERIAKRLARAGIASRREAEAIIAEGRVAVNGRVIDKPGITVSLDDKVTLDGNLVAAPERTRLFLFHKPKGTVTTNHDPEGRPTVFDALPDNMPRVITIGRLDINTEGLLLLTNDGGLSRVLELPDTGWLRRYRVRVHGTVDETALRDLAEGAVVDGVFYGAIEARVERVQGSNTWLEVGLREGKNREIKNVLGSLGLEVTRLIRVSFGPFTLGDLPVGTVQEIRGRVLRDQLGERLIAEAGCDFDGEITQPFPNRPVAKGEEGYKPARFSGKTKFAPATAPASRTEDGEKKNRRPGRGVHVWMAAGARPRSEKEIEAAREDARKQAHDRASALKKAGTGKSRGFKSHGGSEATDADGKPASRSRGFRERPDGAAGAPRGPRPDKPFRPRPDGARPRPSRAESGSDAGEERRPQGGKPGFDKPRFDKPRYDKPRGKPFAGGEDRRPREAAADGAGAERPQGERKPFDGKRTGKPGFGGKPGGKPGFGKGPGQRGSFNRPRDGEAAGFGGRDGEKPRARDNDRAGDGTSRPARPAGKPGGKPGFGKPSFGGKPGGKPGFGKGPRGSRPGGNRDGGAAGGGGRDGGKGADRRR